MSVIIDSYGESNYTSSITFVYNTHYTGQTITGDGTPIGIAKFYLQKNGSPSGNLVAKIYAHTGTWGSTGIPTGSALAISSAIDSSTIPTSFSLISFPFLGSDRITLANGTHYVLTIEGDVGVFNNMISIAQGGDGTGHSGNIVYTSNSGSIWSLGSGSDTCFYLENSVTPVVGNKYAIPPFKKS